MPTNSQDFPPLANFWEGDALKIESKDSAIDGRTTRHAGYSISLRLRKMIEEGFGWAKDVGGLRKVKLIGLAKVAAKTTMGHGDVQPGANKQDL